MTAGKHRKPKIYTKQNKGFPNDNERFHHKNKYNPDRGLIAKKDSKGFGVLGGGIHIRDHDPRKRVPGSAAVRRGRESSSSPSSKSPTRDRDGDNNNNNNSNNILTIDINQAQAGQNKLKLGIGLQAGTGTGGGSIGLQLGSTLQQEHASQSQSGLGLGLSLSLSIEGFETGAGVIGSIAEGLRDGIDGGGSLTSVLTEGSKRTYGEDMRDDVSINTHEGGRSLEGHSIHTHTMEEELELELDGDADVDEVISRPSSIQSIKVTKRSQSSTPVGTPRHTRIAQKIP